MNYIEIKINTSEEGVDVISNILYELGTGGVIIEDQMVKAYLFVSANTPMKLEGLKEEINLLKVRNKSIPIELEVCDVNKEDWVNYWKALFKTEKIGKKVVVTPTWEDYQEQEGEVVVRLDPGAFGTGGHATTASCISFLEEYLQEGMDVIDVGTGSGILALIAAKMGATKVEALDYHLDAVKAAKANVKANNLENIITVAHSDLLDQATLKADLVVSNIIADVIIKLIPLLSGHLKKQGIYICSGIVADRREDIVSCLVENNFSIIEVKEKNGWVTVLSKFMS